MSLFPVDESVLWIFLEGHAGDWSFATRPKMWSLHFHWRFFFSVHRVWQKSSYYCPTKMFITWNLSQAHVAAAVQMFRWITSGWRWSCRDCGQILDCLDLNWTTAQIYSEQRLNLFKGFFLSQITSSHSPFSRTLSVLVIVTIVGHDINSFWLGFILCTSKSHFH